MLPMYSTPCAALTFHHRYNYVHVHHKLPPYIHIYIICIYMYTAYVYTQGIHTTYNSRAITITIYTAPNSDN